MTDLKAAWHQMWLLRFMFVYSLVGLSVSGIGGMLSLYYAQGRSLTTVDVIFYVVFVVVSGFMIRLGYLFMKDGEDDYRKLKQSEGKIR